MKWARLAWVLACGLIVGCGGSASENGGAVRSEAAFKLAVQAAHGAVATAYAKDSKSYGVIVQVTCPYGTWIDAQGFTDSVKTPMKPDMTFRAASITKLFTAVTVLQILSERGIDPATPIGQFLTSPEPALNVAWKYITIEELANHTSGLTEDSRVGPGQNPPGGGPWTPDDIIYHAVLSQPAGRVYQYSNVNYSILAALVQVLTGHTLRDEITRRFGTSVGLPNTVLADSATDSTPVCHGFRLVNQQLVDVTSVDPSWSYGAGNLVSNVSDLTKWLRAMFNGSLLSTTAQATLTRIEPASHNTGFGVQRYTTWWGHTGRISGYASAAFYNPSLDATVVVVVNRWDSSRAAPEFPVLAAIAKSFFPGFPINVTGSPP